MWWILIIGLVGGYALCLVTLVAYVWRVRWQEGFQRGLVGYKRVNRSKP
jgi:hypothetical protein